MREITVFNMVSLDGVMQAPASPDEDPRGGFTHGGWAVPYQDEVMARVAADGMSTDGSMLFGRFTYEKFFSYWPHQTDNPYTDFLNRAQKYVTSRTLRGPLPWENSTLLDGDAARSVADLKASAGADLVVLGSGNLLHTLIRHELVDRYIVAIHPVILGSGLRMFPDDHHARMDLTDVVPTTTGVVIATYARSK